MGLNKISPLYSFKLSCFVGAMEPPDFDEMTREEKNRAKHPVAAWLIVAIFLLYLILLAISAP